MYNHILYFAYWLVNSLVLYVFSIVYPNSVVLGNWRFSPVEASIYSGFWVTFFIWVLWDFAIAKNVKFDSALVTFGYFGLSNFFSFWLVARFSQYAGLGIAHYGWAILVGLTAYIFQRIAWRSIVGKKNI